MSAVLASTYGFEFYLLLAGWPALNWLTAMLALFPIQKKRYSIAWLFLSAVSICSALWMASGFLLFGGPPPGVFEIVGFFIPAGFGAIAAIVFVRRAIARQSRRDGSPGESSSAD